MNSNRPNILWIMTDQQRADALGCVAPWMHTPHLDQLAADGARLANLFAQAPVCMPSRACFATGRYPHTNRVRHQAGIADDEPHLFRVLKAAGYKTGIVGKNHMFQKHQLGALDLNATDIKDKKAGAPEWNAHLGQISADMQEKGVWAGARWHDAPESNTGTHRIGAAACAALEFFAQNDAPFFLWTSFFDPHAPHTAPRRFAELYPLERLPLPANALAPVAAQENENKASRHQIKREAAGMTRATETEIRHFIAVYSAMISFVDEWVGKILAKLDELGLRDNTVVVFTSDHGEFRGEHGMCKKDLVLYDCLLRIPGIVRFPGVVAPGTIANSLCEQIDFHPTLCEWAGAEVPKGVQGRSLVPLLTGETTQRRDVVFAEACPPNFHNPYPDYSSFRDDWEKFRDKPPHLLAWTVNFNVPGDHCKMIRDENWKYIWFARGEEELYDLTNDVGETQNLAHQNPEKCAQLRSQLFEWIVRSEDEREPMDAPNLERICPW